jgi:hypothetical protein
MVGQGDTKRVNIPAGTAEAEVDWLVCLGFGRRHGRVKSDVGCGRSVESSLYSHDMFLDAEFVTSNGRRS